MRALVTGATGHLGSHLVAGLRERGHEVLAIVRPASDTWRLAALCPETEILRKELRGLRAEDLEKFRPDALFHLAWEGVTSDTRNRAGSVLANLENSLVAFEAARGAGCRTWVGVGSQAEYGLSTSVLREDSACKPLTLYGSTKLAVSHLLSTLSRLNAMRFVWFRLFATYGPMDDPRHLIPYVIDHYLRNLRPSLTGGEQVWDYLYVRDAASALIEAGLQEQIEGIFNLASGRPAIVQDIVAYLHKCTHPDCETGLGGLAYPPDQTMFLQGDITKFRNASGWNPQTTIEEGLRATLDWHRSRAAATA